MDLAPILDMIPLGIAVYDEKLQLVYCNKTGYTMCSALEEMGGGFLASELKEMARQSRLHTAVRERLLQFRSPEKWIAYRATAEGLDKEYKHVIVIFRDDTASSRLQETLLKAETLSIVGQLAISALTEIRNPLTVARGFSQLLAETGEEPGKFVDFINRELDSIKDILDEFTHLADSYRYLHTCD